MKVKYRLFATLSILMLLMASLNAAKFFSFFRTDARRILELVVNYDNMDTVAREKVSSDLFTPFIVSANYSYLVSMALVIIVAGTVFFLRRRFWAESLIAVSVFIAASRSEALFFGNLKFFYLVPPRWFDGRFNAFLAVNGLLFIAIASGFFWVVMRIKGGKEVPRNSYLKP